MATTEIIQSRLRIREGLDIWVWKPTIDGKVSTATAWEIIWNKGDLLPWHDWLWNGILPKRVSLCIWKAWFNGFSVDARVQKKGVSLALACDCCSQKNQETIDHVLSSGIS